MDFFRAQHDARRRTRLLIGLFLLSLICLLMMANLVLYIVFQSSPQQPALYVGTSTVILIIVLLGSVFKGASLRRGGEAVAQMLNARLLVVPSNDAEQRLLNVVEEMAIASGTPVPPVYVMDEIAINAFAAGHSLNDAVIGITRGAIHKLNRDELQGVIAHEFSHILHGDMRLNLRLIAWLHGIMVLGIAGRYVTRAASTSRRRNNNNAGIALFGIGLIVIGASGNFFGSLIKAAVSRQREYLADASAVQYTRNPQGIAGALKRIAADNQSQVMTNPAVNEISHALFSEGVHLRFSRLFATHPPLHKRIRVLDPQWNGDYPIQTYHEPAISASADRVKSSSVQAPLALAIARAGAPDDIDVSDAKTIHASLPAGSLSAAHNPLGAVATVCLLLMQEDLQSLRVYLPDKSRAESTIKMRLPADVSYSLLAEMYRVLSDIVQTEPIHRLPLVNVCLGTLRQMSVNQYRHFRRIIETIISTDRSPDLGSWILFQLISQHLDSAFDLTPAVPSTGRKSLAQSVHQLEIFFSLLANCGHDDDNAAAAFSRAAAYIALPDLNFKTSTELDLAQFQHATKQLASMKETDKLTVLNAASICVFHDGKLTVKESELLKMTSETLGWPLPAKIFR